MARWDERGDAIKFKHKSVCGHLLGKTELNDKHLGIVAEWLVATWTVSRVKTNE